MSDYVVIGHARIRFQGLSFESYLALTVTISWAIGFVYALVALAASLLGSPFLAHLLPFVAGRATSSALIGLFAVPALAVCAGAVLAAFTHVPFTVALRLIGGIPVAGEWVEVPERASVARGELKHA